VPTTTVRVRVFSGGDRTAQTGRGTRFGLGMPWRR
jgi:hypothetical protein